MSRIEVSALTVYPVKSMKGIPLERAVLTPEGLANDRRFMVVRDDGQFLSQRQLPRLALIHTALSAKEIVLSMQGEGAGQGQKQMQQQNREQSRSGQADRGQGKGQGGGSGKGR